MIPIPVSFLEILQYCTNSNSFINLRNTIIDVLLLDDYFTLIRRYCYSCFLMRLIKSHAQNVTVIALRARVSRAVLK